MEGGPPCFRQDFSCPAVLRYHICRIEYFAYGAFTLFGPLFQSSSTIIYLYNCTAYAICDPTTPDVNTWFGLLPVRSPLLGQSHLISTPAGTQMVHFPAYRPDTLFYWRICTWYLTMWVTPFGNLRFNRYWPLHAAYRSLSRPSSPPSSKASAVDPYLLDHIILSCLTLFNVKNHIHS